MILNPIAIYRTLNSWRPNLVSSLTGDVLEIGVGLGENLTHYRLAQGVWAIEPDPERAAEAQAAAQMASQKHGIPMQVEVAPAEALPYPDQHFDHVVSSLVFCSVTDPHQALSEIRRVLKADGVLHMVEHVRPQNPLAAQMAAWMTPQWQRMAHNCHLDRPTLDLLQETGWRATVTRRVGIFVRIRAVIQSN